MPQEVKALAEKPGNPCAIPGSHVMEGENLCPQVILSSPQAFFGIYGHKHVHSELVKIQIPKVDILYLPKSKVKHSLPFTSQKYVTKNEKYLKTENTC